MGDYVVLQYCENWDNGNKTPCTLGVVIVTCSEFPLAFPSLSQSLGQGRCSVSNVLTSVTPTLSLGSGPNKVYFLSSTIRIWEGICCVWLNLLSRLHGINMYPPSFQPLLVPLKRGHVEGLPRSLWEKTKGESHRSILGPNSSAPWSPSLVSISQIGHFMRHFHFPLYPWEETTLKQSWAV